MTDSVNNHCISCWLPNALYDRFYKKAYEMNMSKSQLFKLMIEKQLDELDAEQDKDKTQHEDTQK